MYLVMKHYMADDIPVLLTADKEVAEKLQSELLAAMDKGNVFATEDEQRLIGGDIGTELICVSFVTFGADKPLFMEKGAGT